MKISLKWILSIWLLIFLVLGGVVYQASSKLKPEAFISVLTEQVQKNYPGTELKIGKIDYRFSIDFRLRLKNILLLKSGHKLASLGELEIKIPWWLFIANRGNAQINLSHLEILIAESESTEQTHAKVIKAPSDIIKKTNTKVKVELPAYLLNARYTLRAKDIVIKDMSDSRRYLNLSKILVREFQYGKNSAFELNLPIEINHNDARFASELWLFGDVTPDKDNWELNFRGEFKTRDMSDKFQLEDLIIGGKALFNPSNFNINSDINFLIDKDRIGGGKVIADKNELSIDVQFEKFPLNYLSLVESELGNPYLPHFEGEAQGSLSFKKGISYNQSSFQSKLSFDGNLVLPTKTTFPGKWQLNLDDSKWETSFISPQGEISYFRRSIIDYGTRSLVQYNEELGFSGVDLNEAISPVLSFPQFKELQSAIYFASVVSLKGCVLNDKVYDGGLSYGISPLQKFYQLDLKEKESFLKLNYLQKAPDEKLSIELKKFGWIESFKFLSPFFAAKEGILTGKINGAWKDVWTSGMWQFQLDAKGLTEYSGDWARLNKKIWEYFNIDPSSPDQSWNFNLKNGSLNVLSLMIESSDPARLSGSITPANKSYLTLMYPKNRKWKPVRKEITEFNL